MTGRRTVFAVFGLGLAGSQAGHLLAYQIRFGPAAQQVQSSGAHAYFPLVARTTLGAAAAALIGGMLLVGLARVLNGRAARSVSQPFYVSLLAVLFSIQLAAFTIQEVAEALVAGSSVGSAADLLLWGTLGQLPIAALAALALRWLSTRVEHAAGVIGDVVGATLRWSAFPAVLAAPAYTQPYRALLMSRVAGTSLAKRGPPFLLRISTH